LLCRLVNATHNEIYALILGTVELRFKPHKYKQDVYKLSTNADRNIGLGTVTMAYEKALKELF